MFAKLFEVGDTQVVVWWEHDGDEGVYKGYAKTQIDNTTGTLTFEFDDEEDAETYLKNFNQGHAVDIVMEFERMLKEES